MKKKEKDKPQSVISETEKEFGLSRRGFLKSVGTGVVATVAASSGILVVQEACSVPTADPPAKPATSANLITTQLKINGKDYTVKLEPRWTLLDTLRDHLGLTGAKKVCDKGECGACTVLVNGKSVYSCMTLTADCNNKEIVTIEGLAQGEELHPIQKAFVGHDAFMCGFCTPGFIMSLKALLDKNPNPTLDQVKHAVSGNLCRCAAYPRIFEAGLAAAKEMKS